MSVVNVVEGYVCVLGNCTSYGDILAAVISTIILIITALFKLVIAKLAAERISHMIDGYLKTHPITDAIYKHYRRRHAAITPKDCEDGQCHIVRF